MPKTIITSINQLKDMKKENKNKHSNAVKKASIIPLNDRILLKPLSEEEINKTISGIIIPDTVSKEKPEQGKVIAVGNGKIEDGKRIPLSVKVGDRVVFSRYSYDEIKFEGEEYYIMKEENILAIIK